MAAAFPVDHLGDIDGEIECSICTDRFVDARFLSCFHSFCHGCLVEMDETKRITCPLCRQVTPLPENGVAGLRKNGLANLMAETLKLSDSSKAVSITPLCQIQGNVHNSQNKNASLFCETCELAICGDCGMRDHRDQEHHKVVSIDQALAHIKDKLVSLLEWGKEEEKRSNYEEKLIPNDVGERISAVKREVQEYVSQEMHNIKRLGNDIEKELADIDISVGIALEKTKDLEKNVSLSELNHLTEDIINNANAEALLEMHHVICKDYERENLPRPLSNHLQVLSDFAANIRFKKAIRAFPTFSSTFGSLSSQRDWMIVQSRFEAESLPSSLCALSYDTMAVGFQGNESIRAYTKECERCPEKDLESLAVKDMASSTSRDSLVVLDQNNDVLSMKIRNEKPDLGVKRILQQDEVSDDVPLALHTDAEGNVLMLYRDYLSLYYPNGFLMQTVPIRVASLHGESVQVRFQPSENLLLDGANICFLVSDESAVHLCQLAMDPASEGIVWDIQLPDDFPGARRFGELDSEGNVFIANLCDNLVSIRKYMAVDHFRSREVVVDGLQVTMATSDIIHLAAASPDVLFMCTPEKLTVFRRETVNEFLHNHDVV